MHRFLFLIFSFAFVFVFLGCGGDESGNDVPVDNSEIGADSDPSSKGELSSTDEDDPANHSHPKNSEVTPLAKARWPERDTLTANWLMRVFHVVAPTQEVQTPQIGERPVMLLTLNPGEGDAEDSITNIVGRNPFDRANFANEKIDESTVSFELRDNTDKLFLNFDGSFVDGVVVGSIVLADGQALTARLTPTNERTMARVVVFEAFAHFAEMIKINESPIPEEDTRIFIEKYPNSPLGQLAWRQLIGTQAQKQIKPEKLEGFIDEFVAWQSSLSARSGRIAEYDMAAMLVQLGYDVEWCLKNIDKVQASLKDDPVFKEHSERLVSLRRSCEYRGAVALLDSEDDDQKLKGITEAERILAARPFDPLLTAKLADAVRLMKDVDKAIALYGELVALPCQENILRETYAQSPVQPILPSARLAALWKEKHGDAEGQAEFVRKIYDEKLTSFAGEPVEPRTEEAGNHTALFELFTGAKCAPCVASDVALEAIQRTLPNTMVVVLRYHLHIPGPDPLTNEDTEARGFNYYAVEATPSLFLDGTTVQGSGGFMVDAPDRYESMRGFVDSKLEEKTDVKITLSANRAGAEIKVSASVDGADLSNKNLRLRLVLAESEIEYQASTGIRKHDMVVRKLIGGDRGIAAADDKLAYQETIDVSGLRDGLHQYLTSYEQNQQGVEFASMPLELKSLSVVAFVQDVETRDVLQTIVVPVTEGVSE